MKLGNTELLGKCILAPLAGISDSTYRQICRSMGAALVCTEMVSAEGLVRKDQKTRDYASFAPNERPIAIQLFGSDPAVMADAALLIEHDFHPDFIDLNFGCPVPKVVKRGAGAALAKDLTRAEAIVRAVCNAVTTPVLVKIRSGWDSASINDVAMATNIEAAGATAVTLHARTQTQYFTGKADWTRIAAVKEAVTIPVIGNGDIFSADDATRMLNETGCDLVMVGRACQGNPWIFQQIDAQLSGKPLPAAPTPAERLRICREHLHMLVAEKGEERGIRECRKHIGWYTKGMPGSARLRHEAFQQTTLAGTEKVLAYFNKK